MSMIQKKPVESKTELFQKEFMLHRRTLYGFIYVMIGHTADTDDLFQEVSSILWNKFDQYLIGTNFLAWAKQIARHKIMDFRKGRRRNRVIGLDDETVELLYYRFERIQDQVEDRIEILKRCVQSLQSHEREMISAVYEKKKPIKRLAKGAKISVQAVYKRLGIIHGNLQRCVKRKLEQGEVSR